MTRREAPVMTEREVPPGVPAGIMSVSVTPEAVVRPC
jgi:hypothetical protein